MGISNFDQLLQFAKGKPAAKLAIAVPHTEHILGALALATEQKLITPYISGCKQVIEKIATEHNIDISNFKIYDFKDPQKAIENAIELVKSSECNVLMKGDQSTSSVMSPVLKRANNLKAKKVLSHVYVLQLPNYHKLLFITDGALNIAPNLDTQVGILENAIQLTNALKINTPKVALLSAVEVPTDKMPSTIHALELAQKFAGSTKAIVEGPIAFDAAINLEASLTKNMQSAVAGDMDIALVPFIEAGNILAKSLIYLAKARAAGIILGAKVPIILTSRSDSLDSKFLSIAMVATFINGEQNV